MISPGRRRSIVAAVVVAVAIPATAALGKPKSQITDKRVQATAADAELQALGAKIEPAINKYNAAVVRVDRVQADIAVNQAAIARIAGNLRFAQAELTARLQAEYRRSDPDPLLIALEAGNLTDVLQKVTLLKQAERGTADLALELRSSKRELARRRANLAREKLQAVDLQRQAAAQKLAVERAIAAQKSKLDSLRSDIKTMIAENKRRQAELRRQTLARLAAARAAARQPDTTLPDPGIGGSGGPTTGRGSSSGGTGSSSGGDVATPQGGSSAPAPVGTGGGATAVAAALTQLGVPYVWGGMTPGSAFDCSGLTAWAWAKAGVSLDHSTGSQWNQGTHVSHDQLQPGDLVFFNGLGHEGMYIGNGQFIHAPHTGDVVKISSLSGYYASNYLGAVRPG